MVASASGLKKRMLFPTLKSNLEIPFIRHLVRLLGGIPIPTSTKAFGRFCKVVKDSLRQGDWVHLYPEGMLAPYFDGVRPFHRGAFMFAHDCGVPVVPFVIHYRESASRWRKGRLLLNMTILPPIYPRDTGNRKQDIDWLRQQCFEAMREGYGHPGHPGDAEEPVPAEAVG